MFKEDDKVYKIEVAFDSRSIIVSAVKKGKERRGHFEMSQHHDLKLVFVPKNSQRVISLLRTTYIKRKEVFFFLHKLNI